MTPRTERLFGRALRPRTALLVAAVFGISALVMVLVSGQNSFIDEYDNLLGAKALVDGHFLYTGYWTQHTPGTYILTYPFVLVFGTKLLWIRAAFSVLLAVWTLLLGRRLVQALGPGYGIGLVAAIAVTYSIAWANMLMAETWTAWCVLTAFLLFWLRNRPGARLVPSLVIMLVLGCIPVISALPYLPVSAAIYVMALWWAIERRTELRRRTWIVLVSIVVAPYVMTLLWLIVHGALSDAIFQAVQFNTRYYAAFNPSAPRNAIDGVLVVFSIFFAGVYNALTRFDLGGQPLQFFLTATTLGAVAWLLYRRRFLLSGWICVLLVFTGSRGVWGDAQEGFGALIPDNGNARHTTSLLMVIIVIALIVVEESRTPRPADSRIARSVVLSAGAITASLVFIAGMAATTQQLRNALAHQMTIAIDAGPGSPAYIVNLVNEGTDSTYWMAPLEFPQELFVDSAPATRYPCLLDHMASCEQCFAELTSDLAQNRPRVVWIDPGSPYGPQAMARVKALLAADYFTLDDPGLEGYYFLRDDRQDIGNRLRAAGYAVS